MLKAVIFNKIEDEILLSQDNRLLDDNNLLYFSTNPAIDIYLKEKYEISCQCLSNFLSSKSAAENIEISYILSKNIIERLDEFCSREINEKIGLQGVRFFKALYSYMAYIQLNVYLNLFSAFKNIKDIFQLNEVAFFDHKMTYFMDCSTSLKAIIDKIPDIRAEVIPPVTCKKRETSDKYKNVTYMISRLLKKVRVMGLRYCWFSGMTKLEEYCKSNRDGNISILLTTPLYDLCFLRRKLARYNLIYHHEIKIEESVSPEIRIDFTPFLAKGDEEYAIFKNLIIDDIKNDFIKNICFYSAYLSALDRLNNRTNIKLGIWGNSPVYGTKSLANEFLMSKGINVVGSQHGGLLGNRFNDDVLISDLTRCTHYISYGFDKEDIKKLYPNEDIKTKLFPYGTTKNVINGKKDCIDLLFPITNTMSMLAGGMIREKPDILIKSQRKIIEYLNSLVGTKIVVKPFQGSTYEYFGVLPLLRKCNNIRVIDYLTFEETVSRFRIKAIIFELMSTPFYEALGLDVELFVLNDSVRPVEASGLEKLKKRANYFEDVNELINGVDRFLKGEGKIKRDNSFYHRYVYKDNTEHNILSLIGGLLEDKNVN